MGFGVARLRLSPDHAFAMALSFCRTLRRRSCASSMTCEAVVGATLSSISIADHGDAKLTLLPTALANCPKHAPSIHDRYKAGLHVAVTPRRPRITPL
jgi:hypothetical protein